MPLSTNLPLSADRLWDSIMRMAEIGATQKGGCNRQTLTDLDGEARHLLRRMAEEIGLTVETDRIGNMTILRQGSDPSRSPVAIGSHLDTQPSGGKFDGPLGVLAGFEILRALQETGAKTSAPIVLINWTNEEGSRFMPSMLGSGVAMGLIDETSGMNAVDKEGLIFGQELSRIGWAGDIPPENLTQLEAYFELHIEQGTILENEGAEIGVVTHAAPMLWLEISIQGEEAHAGSSMHTRKDALLAAAKLVCAVNEIAMSAEQRGTIGRIRSSPDSRNVVPGHVWMTVDFRAASDEILSDMENRLRNKCDNLQASFGVTIAMTRFWSMPATPFNGTLVDRCRRAAKTLDYKYKEFPTVIGHDAVNVARRLPAALLFIPCKGGISHNEAEDITKEWAAAGLKLLSHVVLETAQIVL